jgi:lipopolysaccharide export system protein LptA
MTRLSSAVLLVFAATAALAAQAQAQTQPASPPSAPRAASAAPANSGPPNALQGFSKNKDEPVQIEAATLDVRDKDKIATFTGNVHVIQGDTDLRTKKLVVFYEDAAANKDDNSIKAAEPGPGGSSQIKRLEAIGDVFVTQKNQTAQGEKGIFDMKTNIITLTGNVIVSQGQDVLRGEKLVVDRTTGLSRMEGGRVQGIFQRSKEEGAPAIKPPGTN